MARGKTLLSLLDDLRAEIRVSLNPAHNAQVRETQVKNLQRVQDWLYEDFDWPHLRIERLVAVQAGQRFLDVPPDLDLERILDIQVRYGTDWCRLVSGIGPAEYACYDSELGETSYPVRRWRIYEGERLELWPVPADATNSTSFDGQIKVAGIKRLSRLVDDDDRADLDNRLIVLYAAAEMLAASGAKDAKLKLDQAAQRYASLRADLTPRRVTKMFGEEPRGNGLRGMPRVHYRIVQP